jgi:hypothetical protein
VHPVLLVALLAQMSRELSVVPDAHEKTTDSPPAQRESPGRDHKCQGMSLLMPSSAAKEQLLAAAGRRGTQRSDILKTFKLRGGEGLVLFRA